MISFEFACTGLGYHQKSDWLAIGMKKTITVAIVVIPKPTMRGLKRTGLENILLNMPPMNNTPE